MSQGAGETQRGSEPLEDHFLNWFVGFVDGEGCFLILRASYHPVFQLTLRDDDARVLELVKDKLGFGRLKPVKERRSAGRLTGQSQMMFRTSSILDNVKLVNIFEKNPLLSKKARDFATWREAVREKAKGRRQSKSYLHYLFEKIKRERGYDTTQPLLSTPYTIQPRLFSEQLPDKEAK